MKLFHAIILSCLKKPGTSGKAEARSRLTELYFQSVGAAQQRDVEKLFGWRKELIARTLHRLVENRKLVQTEHPSEKGEWFALPGLSKGE